MRPEKRVLAAGVAAACVWMGTNAYAAGSHTISVNATVTGVCKFINSSSTIPITIDPTQTTTLSPTDLVPYQCTNGTTPSFTLASTNGSKLIGTSGTLTYSYASTSGGAGTGFNGTTQSLTVTVNVGQAQAANVAAGTYSDTITVSLNP